MNSRKRTKGQEEPSNKKRPRYEHDLREINSKKDENSSGQNHVPELEEILGGHTSIQLEDTRISKINRSTLSNSPIWSSRGNTGVSDGLNGSYTPYHPKTFKSSTHNTLGDLRDKLKSKRNNANTSGDVGVVKNNSEEQRLNSSSRSDGTRQKNGYDDFSCKVTDDNFRSKLDDHLVDRSVISSGGINYAYTRQECNQRKGAESSIAYNNNNKHMSNLPKEKMVVSENKAGTLSAKSRTDDKKDLQVSSNSRKISETSRRPSLDDQFHHRKVLIHSRDSPSDILNALIDFKILPTSKMIRNEEAPPLPKRQLRVAYKSQEDYLAEQFYLFVEDFLGPLRQGIKEFMANTSNSLENGNEKFRPKSIRIYEGVHILERKCVLDSGIVVEIKFDTKKHKLVKWDFCSFLKYGNIVCLMYDNCDTLLYALIAERNTNNLKEGKISLNIIGKKFSAFEEMKAAANGRIVMLESTSFYTAYRHTITSMRSMAERMLRREREVIPFSKYIVDLKTRIAEPRYSILSNGDFDCLVRDKAMKHNYSRVPLLKTKHWPKAEELGMDGDQHRALRLCLTKELGILQGPPGTGKTWMGLKIVEFMINNRLGCSERGRNPILLLSYTNHALDQFFNALFDIESLQKLLHRSEPPFVRIGSQSNIERIKAVSLTEIRKKQRHSNSKAHRKNIFDLKQKLHENELWKEKTKSSVISPDHLYSKGCISKEHIDSLKQQGADYKKIIFEWLELKNPTFSDSVLTTNFTVNQNNQITLDADDEEDFKSQLVERIVDYADDLHFDEKKFLRGVLSNLVVSEELLVPKKESFLHPFWKALSLKNREKILKYVSMRFRLYGEMMEKEVNKVKNVWELSIDDRWGLYKFWRGKFQELLRQEEITLMQEFEEKNKIYLKEKKIDDIKIVSNCFLVGMTTTGAGMNILQEVLPRIVIVEEAAQVMEQHILGCLTKNVEHLILIGDHQQLRPAVHNYELSKTHKTDVSLMERLVLNRMPYECLSQQHRMRPEISAMLTPTIYKTLRNHPSVLDYERIRGIKNDIFFLCHTNQESQSENSTSHKNAFEAEMIARLCLHLLFQGYSKKGITILSTYKDQVKVIRHCIKSAEDKISHKIYDNKGKISVTTVDNFQGEENEIILLSLVRSNEEMKIGHLKDTKRICVALSRAKNCLFVFGNFQSIQKNETWKKIVFKAKDDGNYGNSILLKCVNHPNKTTEVSKPEDFDMIPFGGCGKPCGYRRECGHICDLTCHAIAAYHERPCEVLVRKVHPRCKHELRLRCSTRLRTPLGYISCRVCEKDSGLPSSSEAQPDQDRDPMSSPW